jgi:hypothetical protein
MACTTLISSAALGDVYHYSLLLILADLKTML